MMYEQKMEAMQTRREECVPTQVPDQVPEGAGNHQQENLKTILDTANCLANENRIMAERLHVFLFGLEPSNEAENRKEPGCFRDALQTQIEISSATNKKLNEILSRLGA